MHKLSYFLLFNLSLVSGISTLHAQQTIKASQTLARMDTAGTEARLIQIALLRPSFDAATHQVKLTNHQLSEAKNSWLNLLSLSLNYNELDFDHNQGATAYVYPKYFFGLTIPIGYIFSRGSEIKIARENQAIAKDNRLEAERAIVADVKSKYRTYLNYQSIAAVQNILVNDQQAAFLQTEKNFRDGKVSITEYNEASRAFNTTVLQQLQYKIQADQVKVQLEQDLGMTLEEALKQ